MDSKQLNTTANSDNHPDKIKVEILGFQVGFKDTNRLTLLKDGLRYEIYSIKGYSLDLGLYRGDDVVNRGDIRITSSKSRATFLNQAMLSSESLKAKLKRHLIELTQVVDEINHQRLNQPEENLDLLTRQEIKEAELHLQSPTLMHNILSFIKQLGVVGEARTALTHYVIFTSRITDEPLSAIVKAASSVGKSYVVSKVMVMFPRDSYLDLTDATAQSFFYAPEDHFAHKIIIIFEKHGSQKTDYSIRTLQSEKKLKLQATVKDPDTGQFKTETKEVLGPTGFITTTTDARIHAENETRNLSIYPDESSSQTKRIHEISDAMYRGVTGPSQDEIAKWQNIQQILEPYPVIISFVEEIRRNFPTEPVRVRRDYPKFLSLLSAITILHQKQRQTKTINGREVLVANLADFFIAKVLFEDTLKKTIFELPPQSEFLITKAKKLFSGKQKYFSIRELAEAINWTYDTTLKWFGPAHTKGFFSVTQSARGPIAARYQVSAKRTLNVKILPEVEDLYQINPDWLGKSQIYHPLTGQIVSINSQESTDVPTASEAT